MDSFHETVRINVDNKMLLTYAVKVWLRGGKLQADAQLESVSLPDLLSETDRTRAAELAKSVAFGRIAFLHAGEPGQ